jgi:hypothetical protein
MKIVQLKEKNHRQTGYFATNIDNSKPTHFKTSDKINPYWSYPDPNFFTTFELEFVTELKIDFAADDIPF